MPDPTAAARLIAVNKWFGRAHALRDVSVTFEKGKVHAIAGENGAGKSTLIKILSGLFHADEYSGTIEVGDMRCRFNNIKDAEKHGIFLVPQELNIVPELLVGEYLFLNREPHYFGVLNTKKLWTDTAYWLDEFNISVSPLARMEELSVHEQQLVSIARALTQGVKLLILDEPTASLTEQETETLFAHIEKLHRHGVTTIYISHRMQEFTRIADVCTVMRDGAVVDYFVVANEVDPVRRVINAMVGRDLVEMYPKTPASIGPAILELCDWSVHSQTPGRLPFVNDVDFVVRAGEVLGVFGLLGSGAFELARSIFGYSAGPVTGIMKMHDKPVIMNSPATAIRNKIAYIPAERKRDGLFPSQSIVNNMSLVALNKITKYGLVNRHDEFETIQHFIHNLRVHCDSVDQSIGELSGGNQQKIIAAKWLLTMPDLLVLEEPTRGVDVGARVEFYALINQLTAAGKAIILVSTDLPEVLGMSDRVFVMRKGKIVQEWKYGEASEEDVMVYATSDSEVYA